MNTCREITHLYSLNPISLRRERRAIWKVRKIVQIKKRNKLSTTRIRKVRKNKVLHASFNDWFCVVVISKPVKLKPREICTFYGCECILYFCKTLTLKESTKEFMCKKKTSEPVFVNLSWSPEIDSQPGQPVRQPYCRTGPEGYIGWRSRFLGIESSDP